MLAVLLCQVRAALGIRKTVVSGGGSLAGHLDLFFEAVGLTVLNGWGLTETSPVLACRRCACAWLAALHVCYVVSSGCVSFGYSDWAVKSYKVHNKTGVNLQLITACFLNMMTPPSSRKAVVGHRERAQMHI